MARALREGAVGAGFGIHAALPTSPALPDLGPGAYWCFLSGQIQKSRLAA